MFLKSKMGKTKIEEIPEIYQISEVATRSQREIQQALYLKTTSDNGRTSQCI